jgi:hypothetical protein
MDNFHEMDTLSPTSPTVPHTPISPSTGSKYLQYVDHDPKTGPEDETISFTFDLKHMIPRDKGCQILLRLKGNAETHLVSTVPEAVSLEKRGQLGLPRFLARAHIGEVARLVPFDHNWQTQGSYGGDIHLELVLVDQNRNELEGIAAGIYGYRPWYSQPQPQEDPHVLLLREQLYQQRMPPSYQRQLQLSPVLPIGLRLHHDAFIDRSPTVPVMTVNPKDLMGPSRIEEVDMEEDPMVSPTVTVYSIATQSSGGGVDSGSGDVEEDADMDAHADSEQMDSDDSDLDAEGETDTEYCENLVSTKAAVATPIVQRPVKSKTKSDTSTNTKVKFVPVPQAFLSRIETNYITMTCDPNDLVQDWSAREKHLGRRLVQVSVRRELGLKEPHCTVELIPVAPSDYNPHTSGNTGGFITPLITVTTISCIAGPGAHGSSSFYVTSPDIIRALDAILPGGMKASEDQRLRRVLEPLKPLTFGPKKGDLTLYKRIANYDEPSTLTIRKATKLFRWEHLEAAFQRVLDYRVSRHALMR